MRPVVFRDAANNGRSVLAASLACARRWDACASEEAQPEVVTVLAEVGLAPKGGDAPPDAMAVEVEAVWANAGAAPLPSLGGADEFERRVNARLVRDGLEAALRRLAPP